MHVAVAQVAASTRRQTATAPMDSYRDSQPTQRTFVPPALWRVMAPCGAVVFCYFLSLFSFFLNSIFGLTPRTATQTVVDPRRLGQQACGFTDEDISDIICLLLPYSEAARQEVRRVASETSQHMVGRDDVDGLKLDYTLEDDSRNFAGVHSDVGEHHIALRFSSQVKDPVQGFTFGRSPNCCDICLQNDPHRRLSKIHFRIYLNEWGVLMLEDMSTNGTVVDQVLLKRKDSPAAETRRTLESGSKIQILMHEPGRDIVFLVRIPNREGDIEEAYKRNLDAYLAGQVQLAIDANETIVPGPGGHVGPFSPQPPAYNGRPGLTRSTRLTSSSPLPQGNMVPRAATMAPRPAERK